jgi:hypothetical protein
VKNSQTTNLYIFESFGEVLSITSSEDKVLFILFEKKILVMKSKTDGLQLLDILDINVNTKATCFAVTRRHLFIGFLNGDIGVIENLDMKDPNIDSEVIIGHVSTSDQRIDQIKIMKEYSIFKIKNTIYFSIIDDKYKFKILSKMKIDDSVPKNCDFDVCISEDPKKGKIFYVCIGNSEGETLIYKFYENEPEKSKMFQKLVNNKRKGDVMSCKFMDNHKTIICTSVSAMIWRWKYYDIQTEKIEKTEIEEGVNNINEKSDIKVNGSSSKHNLEMIENNEEDHEMIENNEKDHEMNDNVEDEIIE